MRRSLLVVIAVAGVLLAGCQSMTPAAPTGLAASSFNPTAPSGAIAPDAGSASPLTSRATEQSTNAAGGGGGQTPTQSTGADPSPATRPTTGPPVLIPGRFTGPAPADSVLHLHLVTKPGAAMARVEAVLRNAGMTAIAPDPGGVAFTATAARAAAFFDMTLVGYQLPGGALEAVPITQPLIPASLAGQAVSVTGFYLPGQRRSGSWR